MKKDGPTRIYLDANAIISSVEGGLDALTFLIELAAKNVVHLCTSEFTLAEVLVGPLKQSQPGLVSLYEEMLVSDDYLSVFPVDRQILRGSADVRATTANKGADAIHLATALHSACTVFVSSDKRIRMPYGMTQIDIDQVEDLDVWL